MLFESARDVKRTGTLILVLLAMFLLLHLLADRRWELQVALVASALVFLAAIKAERYDVGVDRINAAAVIGGLNLVLSIFVKLAMVFGTFFLWALVQRLHSPWEFIVVPAFIDAAVLLGFARMVGDDDDTSGAVRPANP